MRKPVKRNFEVTPDRVFNSLKVARLINYVMWDGKKPLAETVVYKAFDLIKEQSGQNPIEVFDAAVKNAGPTVEVRSRRVGGANYQIPYEVRPDRRIQLALRWIVSASRTGKGNRMEQRLSKEIISAANNEGSAVKKREDTHRMAEANKAFAHLAW